MHIENATNFEVDISINGMNGLGHMGMSRYLRWKLFRPRSSALICGMTEHKPQTLYGDLVFGKRKHGDFIVYAAQNSFNATENHLPRHQIEFQDNNVVLTSVLIRLNVSLSNIMPLQKHTCSFNPISNSHYFLVFYFSACCCSYQAPFSFFLSLFLTLFTVDKSDSFS